jgi:3-oxoacyl-[acyl-carrier protein] reductase
MTSARKTVLITGASSGIGGAASVLAARNGWGICIGYRAGKDRADALASKITQDGGWALPVSLPLDDLNAMDASLSALEAQSISLEALILSGSPAPALHSFLKTTPELIEQQWRSLVVGNQHLMAETWKRFFRIRSGGHIVAILSEAMGPPPWPHMSAYVTARYGLQSLLECALMELGTSGLRVSTVSPDYTDTPMLANVHEYVLDVAKKKRSRFLSADEVAHVILQRLESPPASAAISHHSVKVQVLS